MKKLLLLLALLSTTVAIAQPGRSYGRRAAEKNVEKKMDSTYGNKGRKAIRDHTYENDKRFDNFKNKTLANIAYSDTTFKKGKARNVTTTRLVFGAQGEAYITRDEDKPKNEQWLIFNYKEKANYLVTPYDKSAMKMPLINLKKMIEKGAEREAERNDFTIEPTEDYATIGGHKARRFVMMGSRGDKTDIWVTKDLKLDLAENFVLGAKLNSYKFQQATPAAKDMQGGFLVRMVSYDKKGNIAYTRTLQEFTKGKADEHYFDLSGFQVNDVLTGFR